MSTQASILNLDEETLARAILSYCIEDTQALMYATILGAPHAITVCSLLAQLPNHWLEYDNTNDLIQEHEEIALLLSYAKKGIELWGYKTKQDPTQRFVKSLAKWYKRWLLIAHYPYDKLIQFLTKNKYHIIAPHSIFWPQQLQDIAIHTSYPPPLCLWILGNPESLIFCNKPLGIVGSRGGTPYGLQTARKIAYTHARNGHTIISGGALGIDAAAHWGALQAMQELQPLCGTTIAVFAGGLDHIGPRTNDKLFNTIIDYGGALISEHSPECIPYSQRFLLRNRLIAALSDTVVIAQARLRSGAINTCTWAQDFHRITYAIPGNITTPDSSGCNKLIHEQKAILLHTTNAKITHEQHLPKEHYITPTTAKQNTLCNISDIKQKTTSIQELLLQKVNQPTTASATTPHTDIYSKELLENEHTLNSPNLLSNNSKSRNASQDCLQKYSNLDCNTENSTSLHYDADRNSTNNSSVNFSKSDVQVNFFHDTRTQNVNNADYDSCAVTPIHLKQWLNRCHNENRNANVDTLFSIAQET
ncbi:MAG: DNA-processing protein DprA, partial [Bifidobacteriaceae bacterium]|nr:DNA-processing protein DprA [Bifidobacteriaceae bacterium]